MNLNTTQQLKEIDGSPAVADGKPFTLRTVAVNALLFPYKDEEALSGEEKLARFELASRIQNNDGVQLKAEDVALIKKLIAKAYAPLIVGQTWKMLDG